MEKMKIMVPDCRFERANLFRFLICGGNIG